MKKQKFKMTVLTGIWGLDYSRDSLKDPAIVRDDVEYICVTNNKNLKSNVWKIIVEDDNTPSKWFVAKHNPFKYASTDVCMWLDASYTINDIPYETFINDFIHSNKEFAISLHDCHNSIHNELVVWTWCRSLPLSCATNFIQHICNDLKFNEGLNTVFQTSFYLCKRTVDVLDMFEKVRELFTDCSKDDFYKDDQTLISYVIHTKYFKWNKLILMDFESVSDNKYFKWRYKTVTTNRICFNEYQPMLFNIY